MLKIKIFNKVITVDKKHGKFVINAEFKESEHPRDKDGKFTDGVGGSSDKKSNESKLDIAGIKKRLTKELSSEALSKRLSSAGKIGSGYLESGGESVNASIARSQGLGTAKDIVRELKKEGYDVEESNLKGFIEPSEWHHVGKSMTKTDFYDIEDIDEDALNEVSEYNKKQHNFDELKNKAWAKYKSLSEKDLLERYKEATGDYWIPETLKKKERQEWIKRSILFDDFKKNAASKINKMSDDELFELSSIRIKDFFAKKSREDKEEEVLKTAFYYKPEYYKKLLTD
jgi:hypothetical protein